MRGECENEKGLGGHAEEEEEETMEMGWRCCRG